MSAQRRVRPLAPLLRVAARVTEAPVLLPVIGVLLLTAIWGGTNYLIETDARSTDRFARDSTLELIETYEAQMLGNLGALDQTLKMVKYAHEKQPFGQTLDELRAKAMLPPAFIFKLALIDAGGRVIASAGDGLPASFAGYPCFDGHQRNAHAGLLIQHVRSGPNQRESTLFFSRRLESADGAFAGIVLLTVGADYFTSGYERARLGLQGVLGLLDTEGRFVARRPDEISSGPLPAAWPYGQAWAGTDPMPSLWDGHVRYLQARLLSGYPLAILVGLSRDEQHRAFEARKRNLLWQAAGMSLLLGAILAVLARMSWQLAHSKASTRRDQATYYAAINASVDGFYTLRSERDAAGAVSDFILVDTNERGAQLLATTRDALLGQRLCEMFPHMRVNGTLDDLARVADRGGLAEREWQNHGSSWTARWLYRQAVRVDGGVVVIVRDISERKQAELLRSEQGQVLEMVAQGLALEDVLLRLMQLVETQFGPTKISVLLVDADGRHLRHGAALGLPQAYMDAIDGMEIGPSVGSCGSAVYRKEPVVVSDIQQDPLWQDFRELAGTHGLRSCWSVPVMSTKKDVLGTFTIYSERVLAPTPMQMQLMEMVARIAGIAIERKQDENRIRHMATHDVLTGLPNRVLLDDRIRQAILYAQRDKSQVTVLFLDLDHFKLINDSLGHSAGDELLKVVAQRMTAVIRSTDTVVRVGGDEFVIVMVDQSPRPEALTPLLDRLLSVISEPMTLAGQQVRTAASIGLANYPRDAETPEKLLMHADAAMYRAKELGRSNYQFYTADLNQRVHEKLELQEALRDAVANEEFFLLYQPQLDMRSGATVGAEALVRWQHPTRGLIGPDQFIPLAEESGLIVPIGEWVLRHACAQNKAWQDAGLPPVAIAVNVSARQFRERGLVDKVRSVLAETGLAPQWLELELTESLIMQDLQQAVATMQELQAMGVQLSIDDFGTGYSNLSALKRFPISRLKLDSSFVRDLPNRPDDKAIALAIISLGHTLNLRVLAEGVETDEQFAFLRENGCDEMQGYRFSPPLPAPALAHLLGQAGVVHLC